MAPHPGAPRVRWNYVAAVALAVMLVTVTIPPTTQGEDSTEDPSIGQYVLLGSEDELTPDHVSVAENRVVVDAPMGTSEIRVNPDFVREQIGPWGTDQAFSLEDGLAVFDDGKITLSAFELNETATYSMGSAATVRLEERPMWLSAELDGDTVTIRADAGDSSGQPVRVNASWLWNQEIYTPRVVHEDGTNVPVEWVDAGRTYRLDVPHFSAFEIMASDEDVSAELDAKVRVDGVLSDHTGSEVWDSENRTLKLEIADYLTDIEVLVEQNWTGNHIEDLAVWKQNITNETVDGTAYHVAHFTAEETEGGTLHVLEEFKADDKRVWTIGNVSTVTTMGRPAFIEVDSPEEGVLNVTTEPEQVSNSTLGYTVGVNLSLLTDSGVDAPQVYDGDNAIIHDLTIGGGILQTVVKPQQGTPLVLSFQNSSTPAFGETDGEHTCPPGFIDIDANWEADHPGHVSRADAYALDGKFCWDWQVHPGDNITGDEVSHYQITGAAADMNNQVHCNTNTTQGDEVDFDQGISKCKWNSTTVPPQVKLQFGAHAMEEPTSGDEFYWWARSGHRMVSGACELHLTGPGVVVSTASPHPGDDAVTVACAGIWASDMALRLWEADEAEPSDFVTLPNREEDEAIISYQNRTVNVSQKMTVEIVDTNDERQDTWDALEDAENVDVHDLMNYPTGPQKVHWNLSNIRNATMNYSSDLSNINKLSTETENSDNYKITDWEQGWTGLEAKNKSEITRFNESVDMTTVDWEAPDPVDTPLYSFAGQQVTIGCEGLGANVTVEVQDVEDPPEPGKQFISFSTVDFDGLSEEEVASTSNISIDNVADWESAAQAAANQTADDQTFVENTCGAYDSKLLETITGYDYESTMSASAEGEDMIRETEVHAADTKDIWIRFQNLPHKLPL